MTYRLFLALTLLSGVSLWPASITAHPGKVPDHSLIQKACHGVGIYESECISTLKSETAAHQKNANNGSELILVTLNYVESSAANISEGINAFAAEPKLPPHLKPAMEECSISYITVNILVKDVITAVHAKAYSDAKEFTQVAIASLHKCDAGLKHYHSQAHNQKSSDEYFKVANGFEEINVFVRNMLSAALNILPSAN